MVVAMVSEKKKKNFSSSVLGNNGMGSSRIEIKEDNKFFNRLLSKEESYSNPSFRSSVSPAIAVPFVWESHPGTPKHHSLSSSSHSLSLPPLTPPPSYYYTNNTKHHHPSSRSNLFQFLTPKFNLKRTLHHLFFIPHPHHSNSSSNSSLSSSSSSLSNSSSDSSRNNVHHIRPRRRRRRLWSCGSSVDLWGNEENEENEEDDGDDVADYSRNSRLCFRISRTTSSNGVTRFGSSFSNRKMPPAAMIR